MTRNSRLYAAAKLALSIFVALGMFAASADAQPRHYDHRDDHHDHDRDRGRGYYAPPPVVYGTPYYAPPPVIYGPGVGINLPGVSINIR